MYIDLLLQKLLQAIKKNKKNWYEQNDYCSVSIQKVKCEL